MDQKIYPQPGDKFPLRNDMVVHVTGVIPGLITYVIEHPLYTTDPSTTQLSGFKELIRERT